MTMHTCPRQYGYGLCHLVAGLGELLEKKFGETWDFVPTGLTPSPNVGTPTTKKNLMFILHFRLGLGQPPPLSNKK